MLVRQISIIVMLLIPLLTRLFFYYNERPVYENGDQFKMTHNMNHEPKKNDFSQYFFVDDIFVSVPLYPKIYYGDVLQISGDVTIRETEKGELKTLDNVTITKLENHNPLITVTKFVRSRVEEAVTITIPQKEGGLLLGIILGVRDKIDQDFYEKLRSVGVLHVVAASGQNVSILSAMLLVLLQKAVKRWQAILFTGMGILFYCLLSGFDPPIVRASVMALITFGALLFGRQTSGLLALLLTSYVMVMFSPSLLEDISFQLSFLATFGILTIKTFLDRVKLFVSTRFLKDDLTTTLSAQITTFPILLGIFGSYPLVSLPVNIMILWTVPILMILGGLGALVSLIHPVLATPFIIICYPFLYFFTTISSLFSRFSLAIRLESLPQIIMWGYYLILFGIVLGIQKRGGKKF